MTNLAAAITEIGDKFKSTTSDLSSRLSELERRAAREPSGDYIAANDDLPLAAALLDSNDVQNLNRDFRGKAVVKLTGERAAITSAPATVGSNTSAGTSLVPAHRVPGIVTPYERELRVRDVIGSARTTSNNVEYAKSAWKLRLSPRPTPFTIKTVATKATSVSSGPVPSRRSALPVIRASARQRIEAALSFALDRTAGPPRGG